MMTTNRGVGAWSEVLGDSTVAAAMLDRLLHRSVVINLEPLLTGEEFERAHLRNFVEGDQCHPTVSGRFSQKN